MWITRMAEAQADCFNKRNLNYMCEMSPYRRSWTLENGICWFGGSYDDSRYPPWNVIDRFNLTMEEICVYLFRCLASANFEKDCPCHQFNCTQIIIDICSKEIIYPPPGLIDRNVFLVYKLREYQRNNNFHFFRLNGGIKCREYFSKVKGYVSRPISFIVISNPHILKGALLLKRSHADYSRLFINFTTR
jgi:hypothetical protein